MGFRRQRLLVAVWLCRAWEGKTGMEFASFSRPCIVPVGFVLIHWPAFCRPADGDVRIERGVCEDVTTESRPFELAKPLANDNDNDNVMAVASAFGSVPRRPNLNERADFEGARQVNVFEAIPVARNFDISGAVIAST